MAGDWVADDLPGALTAFGGNMRRLVPRSLQRLGSAFLARMPAAHRNTLAGARQTIRAHYDPSKVLLLRGRIPHAVPRSGPVAADEVQSVTALPRAA